MRRPRKTAIPVALLLAALAAASSPSLGIDAPAGQNPSQAEPSQPEPSQPSSPFPTPESLEDLTETPLPEGAFDRPVAIVEHWTLEGPFPEVAAAVPYRDPSNWGSLLEAEAARRAGLVVSTEAMHCAAREWGRFRLAHGAPPAPSLTTWIGARCSASTPQIAYHHFEGGIPANASEEEIFEGWRLAIEGLLAQHLVGRPRAAGIWYGRHENRAIVVVASGERLLNLEPLSTVLEEDDEGELVLRGEVLVETGEVSASVNRGRFGVADCEPHPHLRLPRFEFRCRTDPKDASAWLSVTLIPPGRLLGRGALGVVLFPAGEPSAEWIRPSLGEPTPVTPETDVESEITTIVNRVREEAGLDPLELSKPQSLVAGQLAPYYFATAFGFGPARSGDLVVLGLIAGWNVEGVVQAGHFASSFVVHSLDLDHLVATALLYPAGRRALLGGDVRRIAVGAVARDDTAFLAGIFGTYSVFEEASHDEAARRVVEALDAARAERGKGPAGHLVRVASLGHLAAGRVQSGEEPTTVLSDLLRQSSQVLGRSVNGWFVEARDLSRIAFPEALLERDGVEVAIGVSHFKPQGAAWGRYVVLIVAAGAESRGA